MVASCKAYGLANGLSTRFWERLEILKGTATVLGGAALALDYIKYKPFNGAQVLTNLHGVTPAVKTCADGCLVLYIVTSMLGRLDCLSHVFQLLHQHLRASDAGLAGDILLFTYIVDDWYADDRPDHDPVVSSK